jgi:hypothetical protein
MRLRRGVGQGQGGGHPGGGDLGPLRQALGAGQPRGAAARRQDPHHDKGVAVEEDGLAEQVAVAGEAAPPQLVRQDRHPLPAPDLLVAREAAAERRLDPEHLEELGQHEAAIALLLQAEPQLDGGRQPRDRFVLRAQLASNLCHLGRHAEAEIVLAEARALAIQLGNQLDLLRVEWLEGWVAAGLGRTDQAIAAVGRVRAAFMAQGNAYDTALVTLEQAGPADHRPGVDAAVRTAGSGAGGGGAGRARNLTAGTWRRPSASLDEMKKAQPLRAFISYSRDSPQHCERVLALAERLAADGCACALDQWEPNPAEGWPAWMDRQLDEADFVLVVCTPGYYRKAKAGRRPAAGLGVRFESVLILNDLYQAEMWNERFVPVLFEDLDPTQILRPLRGYTRHRVDREDGYEDLLRQLTGQPRLRPPRPGKLRRLPPRARPGGPAGEAGVEEPFRCLALRPVGYVARGEHVSIREHLLAAAGEAVGRSVGISTALRGAGGFGKTTLAQALCWDPGVQDAYPGGILWVTMGEGLTEGERLSRLLDLLRLWLDREPPAFATVAAAGAYLRERLTGRRVLVVVDDVWSPNDLAPFRDLGAGASLLATTRDRRNLPAGCRAVRVDAMASEEAVEVLGAGLPDLPRPHLRALAGQLGEWPLLLALVHRQLRERMVEGLAPERALDEVEGVLAEEDLEAFDRDDVGGRELAVGRTLNASLRLLAEDERRHYEDLAIFPEDADVPCATLGAWWELPPRQTVELCRRFDQLSLAARFDAGRETFRLHDVVRACLRGRAREALPDRQRRFLERLRPPGGWPALPPEEPYLWRGLAYHLVEAGWQPELRALVLDFAWLQAKLAAAGVNALLTDYDALGDEQEPRLVQGALRLSAHALADHPEELAGQLLGRLFARTEPGIVALRERLHPARPGAWIRPMSPGLTAPGGALVRILTGHGGPVLALAALPDGRVVSGSDGGSLRIWDLATGETVRTPEGHADWVSAVAALPDGRVVSGSYDRSLRVWDLATGGTVRTLEGQGGQVLAVAALPDGRVVSGSADRTLRVWDLATGQCASGTSPPERPSAPSKATRAGFTRSRRCPAAASSPAPTTAACVSGTSPPERPCASSKAMRLRFGRSQCCPTAASSLAAATAACASGTSPPARASALSKATQGGFSWSRRCPTTASSLAPRTATCAYGTSPPARASAPSKATRTGFSLSRRCPTAASFPAPPTAACVSGISPPARPSKPSKATRTRFARSRRCPTAASSPPRTTAACASGISPPGLPWHASPSTRR